MLASVRHLFCVSYIRNVGNMCLWPIFYLLLFLQALLFVILGISVVAIPISPIITDIDISPRSPGKSGEHSSSHENQIDGLWVLHHLEYLSRDAATSYMKIINGAIVGFWPLPYGEDAAKELFERQNWLRQTDSVSGFPLLENLMSYTSWTLYRQSWHLLVRHPSHPKKCLKDLGLLRFLMAYYFRMAGALGHILPVEVEEAEEKACGVILVGCVV
ncbi:hypothetical protein F5887DRAFT_5716 [Amanita rubescens]|nr:hypothetical protein F5887DRAFT_5716 [Amanita rubescens]